MSTRRRSSAAPTSSFGRSRRPWERNAMAIESPIAQGAATKTFPYALLRAGFPYYTTLGMRRVTTACMDVTVGPEGRLYVICRDDGQGGLIRRTNWDDEDLGTI